MEKKTPKRCRVNMRIPKDLVEFIKEYTKRNGTNMTRDYIQYLYSKKDNDDGGLTAQVFER